MSDEDNIYVEVEENKKGKKSKNKKINKFMDLVEEECVPKKKNGLKKVILGILIIVLSVAFLGIGYYFLLLPSIELNGNKNIKIEFSSSYTEKGFIAKHFRN